MLPPRQQAGCNTWCAAPRKPLSSSCVPSPGEQLHFYSSGLTFRVVQIQSNNARIIESQRASGERTKEGIMRSGKYMHTSNCWESETPKNIVSEITLPISTIVGPGKKTLRQTKAGEAGIGCQMWQMCLYNSPLFCISADKSFILSARTQKQRNMNDGGWVIKNNKDMTVLYGH